LKGFFMRRILSSLPILALALAGLSACGKKEAAPAPESAPKGAAIAPQAASLSPAEWTDATAKFFSPTGEEIGEVILTDALGGVLLRIEVKGLTPGWHGIHLHMVGDCSDGADGFKASGGHINPDGVEHGFLNRNGAHRADLPNLFAGPDGTATAEFFRAGLNLKPSEEGAAINGPYPLLDDDGSAIVIHENADDQLTQPIGGAGARVACAALKG
jgi:Cu-Zn family superoxide dismutase